MNHSKSVLASINLAAVAICFSTSPLQAARSGRFTYEVVGHSVTITHFPKGATGTVSIPAEIEGKPVTTIGVKAFSHCTRLTAVKIPKGVVTIEATAFSYCKALSSMRIPDTVTTIGPSVFYRCTSLKSVHFGKHVAEIGGGVFRDCRALAYFQVSPSNRTFSSQDGVLFNKHQTRIIEVPRAFVGALMIPDSVTSIDSVAFYLRFGLTHVTIGDGVTSIGSAAFALSGLRTITIPDHVTSIGARAFSSCFALTEASIGSGVEIMEDGVFAGCMSLTKIDVNDANPAFSSLDGVLFNKAETTMIEFPQHFAGAFSIPDSVTSISENAFYLRRYLECLTIGKGVTSIGSHAFSNCELLEKLIFLGDAPEVGSFVFLGLPSSFTVYYDPSSEGFTSPEWQGVPSVAGLP